MNLRIITPDKIARELEINAVSVPTVSGEITILPHHVNLFTLLSGGIVRIRTGKETEYLAVGDGYLETDGKTVTILVSHASGQDQVDEQLTKRAIEDAKRILAEAKDERKKNTAMLLLRRSTIDLKLLKKRKRSSSV
ncbi:ATP synthase F1 subunit epsilon [Candidatus Roizmanbacteria bacterium]|nr:ATP synthase F1 subunit epsilon [Candidatus Roizmanbacteria bacterium]